MLLLPLNLKYLRKFKKLTLQDISSNLGMSDQAVSNYENGKNYPPADILYKISEFYNISVDDLLTKDLTATDEANPHTSTVFLPRIPGLKGDSRVWAIEDNSMTPILQSGDWVASDKCVALSCNRNNRSM